MTTCIVLNGWHQGETLILPDCQPTIKLYRPRVTTVCECNPDSAYESEPEVARVDTLLLAFRSVDREVALYSTDGKSHHILARGWIMRQDSGPFYKDHELIYVGCRDHRAFNEP